MRIVRSSPLVSVLLSAALALSACGGGSGLTSPSGSAAGATPTPAPTPEATPTPEPPEEPTDGGEPEVFRVTVKVEQVLGIDGDTRLNSPKEGTPVYVGEVLRFDLTAKDKDGNPTNGSGTLDAGWAVDPPGILEWNSPYGFNPRATVVGPGEAEVVGSFDGVRSEPIRVVVQRHPLATP